ncbi:MAG: hypothetical protein AAGA59_12075 [Actinomycetota bacterium]
MDEFEAADARQWIGRVLRLSAVFVAGLCGAVVGVLVPYLDLSEGPFVDSETQFEQVGWNGSDCYWSSEAAEVDARLAQSVILVPVVATALVACGFAVAAARNTGSGAAGAVDWSSPVGDLVLACGVVAVVSGVAVGMGHGFTIGRLLDPGCVRAGVPGLELTLMIHVVAAVAATAAGVWLEAQSQGRRTARAGRSGGPSSSTGTSITSRST